MKIVIISAIIVLSTFRLNAQHEHQMPAKKDTIRKPDHHAPHEKTTEEGVMPTHAFSKNLPMNRNGSGTGWNPDASPMYMWMKQTSKTDWMFHGNLFLRYTDVNVFNENKRGDGAWSFPNWFMVMMNRKIGKRGLLNATAMMSLDRLTDGGDGYPLLFQSGETWDGQPLVDRQHPHDLFSALSIGYTHMVNKDLDIIGYLGYPGEPALGATTFMHRVSSMNNPDAPLGHHWQDATHITFGVATLGVRYKKFKAEGSVFTGREPDEDRYDFDNARFDSYSYRLSYSPSSNWTLQFSQGFLNSPEALEPDIDITRTTASALFAKSLKSKNHISTALIWGLNDKGTDHREHSILIEGNYQFDRNALYSRYEFIQKSTDELHLVSELGHRAFDIHAFSLGYNRTIWKVAGIEIIAGSKGTIHFSPGQFNPYYGKAPIALQAYLQIRPALHHH